MDVLPPSELSTQWKANMFNCIWCEEPTDSLFIRYTADVVRLQTCTKCGNYVDEYVEYDTLSIFLDLLLQKRVAYRHLIFNSGHKLLWRLMLVIIMAEAYVNWISWRSQQQLMALSVDLLEWQFQKRLLISFFVYSSLFVLLLFIGMRRLRNPQKLPLHIFANGIIISLFPVLLKLPAVIWLGTSTFSMIWACSFLQLISARQAYSILSQTSGWESSLTVGILLGLAMVVLRWFEDPELFFGNSWTDRVGF